MLISFCFTLQVNEDSRSPAAYFSSPQQLAYISSTAASFLPLPLPLLLNITTSIIFHSSSDTSLVYQSSSKPAAWVTTRTQRVAQYAQTSAILERHVTNSDAESFWQKAPCTTARAKNTMGVAIFNNGFLLVGERVKDWSEVWYRPEPQGDDTPAISLHSSSTDDEQPRAPMRGEVKWFTQFDIKNMESTERKEREIMQRQTLYDAWVYMNEMNPKQIKALEKEFNKPNERRWQSWFMHAVRAKRLQFQRAAQAASGTPMLPGDDVDATLFGAAFENHMQLVIRKRGSLASMPPPPPGPLKRKGARTDASSRKRQRAASDDWNQDSEPTMSGGLDNVGSLLDPSHDRTKNNGLDYLLSGMKSPYHGSQYSNDPDEMTDNDDDDDNDETDTFSSVFDASTPEAPSSGPGPGPISRPSSSLGSGLSGFAARKRQAQGNSAGTSATPPQPPRGRPARAETVTDEEFRSMNANLDEDAAFAQAMRASMQPDGRDFDHDPDLQDALQASMQSDEQERMREAIRQSLERENQPQDTAEAQEDDVRQSTESPDESDESTEAGEAGEAGEGA